MGKIMYKGQAFQGKIERESPGPAPKPDKKDYLVYKWDFTKSLVDEINGIEIGNVRGNLTPSENGIYFTNGSDSFTIDISENDGDYYFGKTIELEFGATDFSVNYNSRDVLSFRPKTDFRTSGGPIVLFKDTTGNRQWGHYMSTSPNSASSMAYKYWLRYPKYYNDGTKRTNLLSNNTIAFYQDTNGSLFMTLNDLLIESVNHHIEDLYYIDSGNTPVSSLTPSIAPGTNWSYFPFYKEKRYVIIDDAYMCFGDVKESAGNGFGSGYLKGIRIYDGMFIDLSTMSAYEPPVETEGGD